MKFQTLFTNFMLIGLITMSMFALTVTLQSDNSVSTKFIDDTLINATYSDLSDSLTSLRDDSQTQKALFESENPTSGFGSILLFSIVSSGKVFNGMIVGLFNTIIKLPTVIFGLDPIITSVLSTILVIIIILGLWAIYKLGG